MRGSLCENFLHRTYKLYNTAIHQSRHHEFVSCPDIFRGQVMASVRTIISF
jgi:hypothetical protein